MRRDAIALQLGITYKEMSLSLHSGDTQIKLSAGDRAPDAPGQDAGGKPVRLFDYFRGPHFTFLRIHPSDDRAAAIKSRDMKHVDIVAPRPAENLRDGTVFVDTGGHFAAAYGGGSDEYVLVRPDGYIAWIGNKSSLPELESYLSNRLGFTA
jgi:hypothetical protein